MPTVLITGTSSGIGLATAIAAAKAGWTTVATMRDTAKAGALNLAAEEAGVTVNVLALDVTDDESVHAVVADVVDTHGSLDAVVNNAGAAQLGTAELMPIEDFRTAMEVNFFGVVRVSQAALPHLRASHGRLLTVTSVGGVVGQPFNDAYCAAKFAAEGFLESLHPVAKAVGVGVIVVEPGAVASEFLANAGVDVPAALAAAGPYAPALGAYLQRTAESFAAAQTSAEVGQIIVDALTGPTPPFRLQTSDRARAFVAAKLADLDGSTVTSMTAGWVGLV